MLTEIKRPEVGPNADALTSLTRGRGPRRGNLEELLKYWRPIMKKPGGFRRCVVILMDKPQFGGKPQRICAWLHHEITGKWPNEGKGSVAVEVNAAAAVFVVSEVLLAGPSQTC